MTNTKPSVKIFEAYFKPWDILETDIITPIQCGKADSEYDLPMIGDDTGDNISDKNFMYNELTAQYWAWKNDSDYDYIGFMHYRRHLNFGKKAINDYDEYYKVPGSIVNAPYHDLKNVYHHHYIDDEYKQILNLNNITTVIKNYDIIVPNLEEAKPTVRDQYITYHMPYAIDDLKIIQSIIKHDYPEYLESFIAVSTCTKAVFCNIFIMKKDLFNDYASFAFDILFKFEKQVHLDERRILQARACGYLGERLFNIFVKFHENDKKIKYLQRTFINKSLTVNYNYNELITDSISAISIALCFNLDYLPHNYILIKSIMQNSNSNDQYNIYCLIRDMQYDCVRYNVDFNLIETFNNLEREYPNLKVIFIDVSAYKKTTFNLPSHVHYTIDTFTRLFIPDILPNVSKIIYLDGDIIVCDNIKELFDYDVTNLAAGVVYETMMQLYLYNNVSLSVIKNLQKYIESEVADPYIYFNAGVLLLNLNYIRENSIQDQWYELLSTPHLFVDQDILNNSLDGLVKWVDPRWNVWAGTDAVEGSTPVFKNDLRYKDYMYWLKASKNPGILHYAGGRKPYNIYQPYNKLAYKWWEVARMTPFHEYFLLQIIRRENKEKEFNSASIKRYLLTKHPKLVKYCRPFYWGMRNISRNIKSVFKRK